MLVRYDSSDSDARIARTIIDLVNDDEPPLLDVTFNAPNDGRTVRGQAVKPVREGAFMGQVTVWDVHGCSAQSSTFSVTVTK